MKTIWWVYVQDKTTPAYLDAYSGMVNKHELVFAPDQTKGSIRLVVEVDLEVPPSP